jgi:hypothetical protein
MPEWWVRLHGNDFDLRQLPTSFVSPELHVEFREGSYCLMSTEFNALKNADEVRERAATLVELMNGAMQLHFGDWQPVEIAALTCAEEDGTRRHFVYLSGKMTERSRVSARLTVGSQNTIELAPQPTEAEKSVAIAARDPAVAEVVRILGSQENDWSNLYKVFELVRRDVGGEPTILRNGWLAHSKVRLFRQTAQTERHASGVVQPPRKRMSLSEGNAFIRELVQKWVGSKG